MQGPSAQTGAVLAVALLLLAILTLLALGASNLTRSQGVTALAVQHRDLAFQSAEATLVLAERLLTSPAAAADAGCNSARCRVYPKNSVDASALGSPAWWRDHSWAYMEQNDWIAATEADRTTARGQFFIEELQTVHDSLAVAPDGSSPRLVYYRVTARAGDPGASGVVMLQSTFARRFD